MKPMNALVVYVGGGTDRNFRHGSEAGVWGFRDIGDLAQIRVGDLMIFGRGFSGGSPRVSEIEWRKYKLGELAFSYVTEGHFDGKSPEWPDEAESKQIIYPYRLRFKIPLQTRTYVSLNDLDPAIADALRRSAIANGRANYVLNPNVAGWIGDAVPRPVTDTATLRTESDLLSAVHRLMASRGHTISALQLTKFYAAIRAKPFVILAGNSGTGKSRLVRLFAEACGATAANGGFHMVAVRPDWSDGGELLGYLDLQNTFRPGQLLEPLLRAHAQPQQPVFVCLDEMNLARVEHYFSDFLSKIESRRRADDGSVVSDAVISARDLDLLSPAAISESLVNTLARLKSAQQGVCLPPNLIVVGTVNMDETTHAFSRKVLDRANTLEIDAGRLGADLPSSAPVAPPTPSLGVIDLTAPFLTAQDMVQDPKHAEALAHVASLLDALNYILCESNLQVAYRTRDEAAAFFIHATAVGLSSDEADHAIVMQKILPRVQGSSPRLARILRELLGRFQPGGSIDSNSEKLNEELVALRKDTSRSPLVRKIASMWLVYQEEGFTSFWVA